jgi:hypothetical protein
VANALEKKKGSGPAKCPDRHYLYSCVYRRLGSLMKDTGKEQLYGLVSDSLIATMVVSLLYAAPMATLYWLNATEPTAHLVKRLLGASLLMLGVIGGCETLTALFSFYVDTSRTDLWAHTLTSVAINPHGFFLIRVLVTVVLVVLVLIVGFLWIHRQRSLAPHGVDS